MCPSCKLARIHINFNNNNMSDLSVMHGFQVVELYLLKAFYCKLNIIINATLSTAVWILSHHTLPSFAGFAVIFIRVLGISAALCCVHSKKLILLVLCAHSYGRPPVSSCNMICFTLSVLPALPLQTPWTGCVYGTHHWHQCLECRLRHCPHSNTGQ